MPSGPPCKDCAFPAREISVVAGDRFLLYTDGLAEPENFANYSATTSLNKSCATIPHCSREITFLIIDVL